MIQARQSSGGAPHVQLASMALTCCNQPHKSATNAQQDAMVIQLDYRITISVLDVQQASTARQLVSQTSRIARRAHLAGMALILATRQRPNVMFALLECTALKKLERARATASHVQVTQTVLARATSCDSASATLATSTPMVPRKMLVLFARVVPLGSIAAAVGGSVSWIALLVHSGGMSPLRQAQW